MLQLIIEALNVDDISKARIEETIFTSPKFQELKNAKSISLKQEQEIKEIISIVTFMLSNGKTQVVFHNADEDEGEYNDYDEEMY